MMFCGAVEHGDLQAALYPLPEEYLTQRVTGSIPLPDFVRNGVVDANRVHQCLEEAGFDFEKPARMLDFGCGCGRLIRVIARHADTLELHGADVDADAVGYCAATLDFATFCTLPKFPPSGYDAGAFDAVYAYSVFSHLSEADHLAWIAELARITAPGGLVVLTTQGRRLVEHLLAGCSEPVPTPEALKARLHELEQVGFLFFPYESLVYADERNAAFFSNWDMCQYGMTFILEPYIRRRWLELFELVSFVEAPDDWQDFVILRRR